MRHPCIDDHTFSVAVLQLLPHVHTLSDSCISSNALIPHSGPCQACRHCAIHCTVCMPSYQQVLPPPLHGSGWCLRVRVQTRRCDSGLSVLLRTIHSAAAFTFEVAHLPGGLAAALKCRCALLEHQGAAHTGACENLGVGCTGCDHKGLGATQLGKL